LRGPRFAGRSGEHGMDARNCEFSGYRVGRTVPAMIRPALSFQDRKDSEK
jgi:hypothetical protein